jgi:hypothetical protein
VFDVQAGNGLIHVWSPSLAPDHRLRREH